MQKFWFQQNTNATQLYTCLWHFCLLHVCMHVGAHVQRTCQELFLFVHTVSPRDRAQVFSLWDRRLHPLSHLIYTFLYILTKGSSRRWRRPSVDAGSDTWPLPLPLSSLPRISLSHLWLLFEKLWFGFFFFSPFFSRRGRPINCL